MTDAERHCRTSLQFTWPNTEGPNRICEVDELHLRALLDEVTRLRTAASVASAAIHWLYEAHRNDVDPWSEGPLQDFGKADHPLTLAQDTLRSALDGKVSP